MAFKYMAGRYLNLLTRAGSYGASPTATPESSGTADASYPLANLYNGVPALPYRISSTTAGMYVRWANNLVVNGDMEQSSLTGWTASSATLTSETGAGLYHKGTRSMKVVTSSAGGGAYQDIAVQAGEYLQVWAALRSDGTNLARVTVRCLDTNQDLNSSGVWSAVGTFAMTRSTATMAAITPIAFQVPSYATIGKATATIRVLVTGAANAQTFYADEVLIVPALDFVGVFGHGFDPSTGVALVTFGANYWHSPASVVSFGSATNGACAKQIAIVTNGSRVYDPFPGVFFYPGGAYGTYSSRVAPWIGELVVGQTRTFPRSPSSFNVTPAYTGQMRAKTRGGSASVFNANAWSRRDVKMSVMHTAYADADATVAEFLGMTEGGRYPVVLLPESLDTTAAIYGRVTDALTFDYEMPKGRFSTTEITVEEEALPRLT